MKVVLLYSGGADSTLLLRLAKSLGYEVYALIVDYGQINRKEINVAINMCETHSVPYSVATVDMPFIQSKLTGQDVTYPDVSPMHVPGRNTIFIGMALSYAETIGAEKVWIGSNFEDRLNRFPDCYQDYIVRMREAVALGASRYIELEAPLLGMCKKMVVDMLKAFGVDLKEVHSGYSVE